MTLDQLGWQDFFEESFQESAHRDWNPARVVRHDRQSYQVVNENGEFAATLLGRLQYDDSAEKPVVGDWVLIEAFDQNQAVIHKVLPRRSVFSRKVAGNRTVRQVIAANVDIVFLVSGLDHDFNIRRIERYLIQAVNSGALPIILLNKADLCSDLAHYINEVHRIAPGVEVIPLSALEGSGIDLLVERIKPGETVAFLGSSGVGKSSLVNRLVGYEHLKTGAVREDDSRGRHTTSHRELVVLPTGGLVIDTPGMRELQLWGEEEDLHAVFNDIEALAETCRFNDCQHETEPGCAIHAAIAEGNLDEDRFWSYQKLKRELAYLDRRKDEASILKARKEDRARGRLYKSVQKHNPKRG